MGLYWMWLDGSGVEKEDWRKENSRQGNLHEQTY